MPTKRKGTAKEVFQDCTFLFISGNIGWLVTMPGNKKGMKLGPKLLVELEKREWKRKESKLEHTGMGT